MEQWKKEAWKKLGYDLNAISRRHGTANDNLLSVQKTNILDQILNAKQAAGFLQYSSRQIIKLAKQGVIPGVKIGNSWRFSLCRIIDIIK